MKTCFKCLTSKPLSEFYRHHMMADGHLGKCKDCTRRDVKLHRQSKIDRIRQYDRERADLPHRKALRERVSREWQERYPDRRRAHHEAANATRGGKLSRPGCCEGCGKEGVRLERHHHDYAKPLVVVWLCRPCHAIADKIRRKFEAA